MFSWNLFEKITKNVISRKQQGFEQSNSEARFSTPEGIIRVSNYRMKIFKIFEHF